MAATVVAVRELPIHGRTTGVEPTDYRDILYYSVEISEPDANARSIVLGASGIPVDGQALAGTGRIVLRRRADAEPGDDSGCYWRVEIEYGAKPDKWNDGTGGVPDPWDSQLRLEHGVILYERVLEKDFAASPAPIVNSAGDPFDPPIMFKQFNRFLRIRYARRTSTFNPWTAQNLIGSLNSTAFLVRGNTVDIEKALLHNVSTTDQVWSDGTEYYDIVLEMEIERDVLLKNPKRLNKGFREKRTISSVETKLFCTDTVYDSATSAEMLDANGNKIRVPVNAPVFLSSDGTRYTGTTPETDCVLQFTEHQTSSWSALDL